VAAAGPALGVGAGAVGGVREGNEFRSKDDLFAEKPRQMLALGGLMAVMTYLAYVHRADDKVGAKDCISDDIM
jgi:hypothetical protein